MARRRGPISFGSPASSVAMCGITRSRPTSLPDWLSRCIELRRSRACHTGARAAATGGANPTLGPAELCGLPRVRVSRAGAPPASSGRARPRSRRLPYSLETDGGSPIDSAELFGAALGHGQRDRFRAPPRRRGTEPAGNRAARDPASPRQAEAHTAGDITPAVWAACPRTYAAASMCDTTHAGLRDRALIRLMVYSFARIGAGLGMTVEMSTRRTAGYGCGCARRAASGTRCRATITSRNTLPPISTVEACAAIQGTAVPHDRTRHRPAHAHRATASERVCDDPPARGGSRDRNQTRQPRFPSESGGDGEPCSTRTTQLYDRRRDELSLDEVERIVI